LLLFAARRGITKAHSVACGLNQAQSPFSLCITSIGSEPLAVMREERTASSIATNALSIAARSGGPAMRVAPTGPNRSGKEPLLELPKVASAK